jgi:uncharacterized HAD superfamily protein
MDLVIDIDGTICTEEKTFSRSLAKPLPGAVESVNKLYNQGHTIRLFTARSWVEYEVTKAWLDSNGFKYHQLLMGKPLGDVWIDDRAIGFTSWNDVMEKLSQ